jgi:branched-chain amino acid aminotransferase
MTPEPRNILRGTRRAFVLELAEKLGIPAQACNIESYDVASADEAFFTSTAFTMLPCTKFNGLPIGDGKREPIFQKILDAFSEAVGVDIEAQTKAFAVEVGNELAGTTTYGSAKGKS